MGKTKRPFHADTGSRATFVAWLILSCVALAVCQGGNASRAANYVPLPNAAPEEQPSGGQTLPQGSAAQWDAYKKCMEAEKRAEGHVFAAMPGRSWRWRLDFERTRQDLDSFGQGLDALKSRQSDFEASLKPPQKSRFDSQLRSIHALSENIRQDFQSLQDELHKGYPARWHVDADTWHMYKELVQ